MPPIPPSRSTAGVLVPPPFVYLGAIAAGLVLQHFVPLSLLPGNLAARSAGGVLILFGLAFSVAVVRRFGRAGTPVTPRKQTRRLVVTGPYRWSRNPDYLGQTLATAGLGLLLASGWVLIALVPALLLVRVGVIAREERYLERRFGEDYRAYRRRVRRWL
jgi:protein-S-isoprenylcysteine O-methyltransferase Ste14